MSETASTPVTPQVIVSRPADEAANIDTLEQSANKSRPGRRSKHMSQELGRSGSGEWVDVDDDTPTRRRRSSRRSARRHEQSARSSLGGQVAGRKSESELARFFPSLSRILESGESTVGSRPASKGVEASRRSEKSTPRRRSNQDDAGSSYRRPVRHRTSGVQRRGEGLFKINPSLLSVLSSLTASTDRSSGSNSTVTQNSYNRRDSDSSRTPVGMPRRSSSYSSEAHSPSSTKAHPRSPNVFDYMVDGSSVCDTEDSRSVMSSSSSSHYEASIAGSSEAPDTPSSRSTFPSPTSTRTHSVAELRRKYDPQYTPSEVSSVRHDSPGPGSPPHSSLKSPTVSDVDEDEETPSIAPTAPSELNYESRQRSTSRSSRSSHHSSGQLGQQEEARRQHMAYASQRHPAHYVDPVYGQHRSPSPSSTHSSPYGYHMAMQQYQWASPPALPPQAGGLTHPTEPPPCPDAPDLTQRTISGYEKLALELASTESPVKPLYRKFEYLNHRILLHLQDELAELEEHLRTLDEIIAQTSPPVSPGVERGPASRRAEAYSHNEIYHQRTNLLGRIFLKSEQYNRAMTAYTGMTRSSTQPPSEQVEGYRQWMTTHKPVHEIEARFLQHKDDLMSPSTPLLQHHTGPDEQPLKHAALAYFPVALMLPLLLFSIVPSLLGRLAVTVLIAAGAFSVAGTTRIRFLLPVREWAVCGAAYVLVMAAVAGCIPQH